MDTRMVAAMGQAAADFDKAFGRMSRMVRSTSTAVRRLDAPLWRPWVAGDRRALAELSRHPHVLDAIAHRPRHLTKDTGP